MPGCYSWPVLETAEQALQCLVSCVSSRCDFGEIVCERDGWRRLSQLCRRVPTENNGVVMSRQANAPLGVAVTLIQGFLVHRNDFGCWRFVELQGSGEISDSHLATSKTDGHTYDFLVLKFMVAAHADDSA
jgi:hypothetical protein